MEEIAKQFALNWLNSVSSNVAAPLPDDYFTEAVVMYSTDDPTDLTIENEVLFEMRTADDGGPARMFAHFLDGKIVWGAWYFDGTWGEMK
jgi:hypothetical protein